MKDTTFLRMFYEDRLLVISGDISCVFSRPLSNLSFVSMYSKYTETGISIFSTFLLFLNGEPLSRVSLTFFVGSSQQLQGDCCTRASGPRKPEINKEDVTGREVGKPRKITSAKTLLWVERDSYKNTIG